MPKNLFYSKNMEPSDIKKENTDVLLDRCNDYRKNIAVKAKLAEGFKPIALTDDVWAISSRQKTFTEHTELHHELGRLLDILMVINKDYFQVLDGVKDYVILHVLKVAQTNPRLAQTNFYTLFKDFKVPSLQKVLTKTSVVPIDNENAEVAHTEDFMGGWNIVRMKSALDSEDGFNYWMNAFPKRVQNEPVQIQPYGPLQCVQLLEVCEKILSMDRKFKHSAGNAENTVKITILRNHLAKQSEDNTRQGQDDTSEEIQKVIDKVGVIYEMNSFPALVSNYCLNAIRTVLSIVENSINQMEDKVLESVANKAEEKN